MTLFPPTLRAAALVVLLGAAALIGGALVFQYGFDLPPCKLCIWQRWPHGIAIGLGILALVLPRARLPLVALAALSVAVSGGIGFYHAGVEYGVFQGPSGCSAQTGADTVEALRQQLMQTAVVRCDEAPWTLFGISLAGYNFLASGALALYAGWAVWRHRGSRTA